MRHRDQRVGLFHHQLGFIAVDLAVGHRIHRGARQAPQRGLPTHYRAIWLAEKLSAFQDFALPSFQAIKVALAPHEEEIASLRWEAKVGNCQRACNFSFTGVQS
ncbi:hypothetical protein ACODUI_11680 [Stenotrophomonas geniculata]